MIGCDCNAGLSNYGRPSCVPLFSIVSSLIQVPLIANDGTPNRIDLSLPFTAPNWSDLVNEADASKRWFPLPAFENVELPKADSQFEEANSGRMAFLRQGKRSFSGELWAEDSTPTLLGKMVNARCVDTGVYAVDVNGNLIGSEVDGYLYPIAIDSASWNPVFNFATDSTVQKIMLGFDFDRLFDESTMYMINPTEAGIDFTTLTGLIDVIFSDVTATITEAVYTTKFCYGTAPNKLLFKGAIASDFVIENITGAYTMSAPLTFVENPDGTYTFTYQIADAPNVSDVLSITVSKTGFNGTTSVIVA